MDGYVTADAVVSPPWNFSTSMRQFDCSQVKMKAEDYQNCVFG